MFLMVNSIFYNENNSKTIILNWLTSEHMPVNENQRKCYCICERLDNLIPIWLPTSFGSSQNTKNTSSEEDLDASLKIANETYKMFLF
jgi:hypothetical protein